MAFWEEMSLEAGLAKIKGDLIDYVIEYLDTGVFRNKNNKTYVNAYSAVLHYADQDSNDENGQKLYNYYVETIAQYCQNVVLPDLRRTIADDVKLLDSVLKRWENHKMFVYWMRKIFNYLDRFFIKNKQGMDTLFQKGLNIFRKELFDHIKEEVSTAVINQIKKERESESIDRERIKHTLTMFVQMGLTGVEIVKDGTNLLWKGQESHQIYKQSFEEPFLEESGQYYAKLSQNWLTTSNCPEYISAAAKALFREEERADKYLDPSTKPRLLRIIEQEIIERHAGSLAEMSRTGCEDMFKHDRQDQLAEMYSVFHRCPSTLQYITNKMRPYIESKGEAIVTDPNIVKDSIEFTNKLLALKKEMDGMVEKAFHNHSLFQKTRDQAFQNFMNKCAYSPHYIASYCDNEFRRGLKGVSTTEADLRLEAIIKLFICLNDRDVFIRSYTKFLAQRLLSNSTVSDEYEQMMIAKLKVECGHNTVNKLSRMFTDIAHSKTLNEEFKMLGHSGRPGGILSSFQVLTNGHWPEQAFSPCQMPSELNQVIQAFENFYQKKHNGRNLTWLYNQGNCEVSTLYLKKKYTVVSTVYQTAVLLLFNNYDVMTYAQIREATKVQESELEHQLAYLFHPKMKLLKKDEEKKAKCSPDEKIRPNPEFVSQNIRCSFVPSKIKKKKDDPEQSIKKDDPAIEMERKHVLDSVIVRIMKSRKTEKHNELIAEVIKQTPNFKPQPGMIKLRIESLIEREYLKRDDNDRSKYIYLP